MALVKILLWTSADIYYSDSLYLGSTNQIKNWAVLSFSRLDKDLLDTVQQIADQAQ
jgi:hypothetical protein